MPRTATMIDAALFAIVLGAMVMAATVDVVVVVGWLWDKVRRGGAP
jgi:hypothetical protein